MKIVKYKVFGSLEDNYVEDDYWNDYKYFGFEFDNGKVVVLVISENNYGDDCNGSEWDYRFLNEEYGVNDKFYKGFLWLEDEVGSDYIKLIEECVEDRDLEWEEEGDVEEIIYCED